MAATVGLHYFVDFAVGFDVHNSRQTANFRTAWFGFDFLPLGSCISKDLVAFFLELFQVRI